MQVVESALKAFRSGGAPSVCMLALLLPALACLVKQGKDITRPGDLLGLHQVFCCLVQSQDCNHNIDQFGLSCCMLFKFCQAVMTFVMMLPEAVLPVQMTLMRMLRCQCSSISNSSCRRSAAVNGNSAWSQISYIALPARLVTCKHHYAIDIQSLQPQSGLA